MFVQRAMLIVLHVLLSIVLLVQQAILFQVGHALRQHTLKTVHQTAFSALILQHVLRVLMDITYQAVLVLHVQATVQLAPVVDVLIVIQDMAYQLLIVY
jgi:hypothetical protein